ncbi:MAG: hypothetical protein ACYSUA_13270 [Planctomycetota bacterium]|jgi:hypothetical protein
MGNENRPGADEGVMVSILRRFLFAAGAVLLAGGWGLTGFVGQHQQAAGDDAFEWWVEGVELSDDGPLPHIAMAPSSARAGGSQTLEQVFHMLETDGGASTSAAATPPQAPEGTSRALWPSMWLYLAAVAAMAVGAGVMVLGAPWLGGDDGAAYESAAQMPLRLQRGP